MFLQKIGKSLSFQPALPALAAAAALSACDGVPINAGSASGASAEPARLTAEERELIEANDVFKAVLDRKETPELESEISKNSFALFETNSFGNTPLGTAVRLRYKKEALVLLENHPCDSLNHTNHKGESYAYLAAEAGWREFISGLADICYKNQKEWIDGADYEFSFLDPETKTGEKALHAAATYLTAEALAFEYEKRGAETDKPSFLGFTHHEDKNERTFLHAAVADGRLDLVRWAVERECGERKPGFWKTMWKAAQSVTLNMSDLINYQDKDGNGALHLAAANLNGEALEILSLCPHTNYDLENAEGEIPLQTFLKNLDPVQERYDSALKEPFRRLAHSETRQTKWLNSPSDYIDHKDKNGDSSLHTAARLADPFFYNYLKPMGLPLARNKTGETAKNLFQATRKRLNPSLASAAPLQEKTGSPVSEDMSLFLKERHGKKENPGADEEKAEPSAAAPASRQTGA